MTLQTDSSQINEGKTRLVDNKQCQQQSKSKVSVQSLRYFDQIDYGFLNNCSTQQLINRLEHKLTVLRFVFDLHQSIVIKQKQRYERVGFPPVNTNKKQVINNKDSMNINNDQQSNQINNQRLKNVIIDTLFYQDLNKIQLIKCQIENHVKVTTKHLYGRIRSRQKFHTKLQQVYGNVEENRYGGQKQQTKIVVNQQQSKKSIQKLINLTNFQSYIDSLYQYLLIKFGDINLYDLLKQLTQRWICDIYQQQEQRCFNLLNQIQKENGNQQNQKLFLKEKSTNEETTQTNNIKLLLNTQTPIYGLVKQRKIHIEQQNKEFAFLQLLHQTKTRIKENTFFEAAVIPIDNFNKPCCNTFLYKFSRIHSNKYSSNPKNDHLIFITKQSLGQQDSQQGQKSFKQYELAIKQATAALLNNNGGFIFVGFKKQGLYYSPQCPFLLTENSTKEIQESVVEAVSKEITLFTGKNEKQQLPYKNIHVDFIPIFKQRSDTTKMGNFANEGEFVWRIKVQPNNWSKLKIHSIMETFYDLDNQNQTCFKLLDTNTNKDTIYNKLKSMLDYYDLYKAQQQSILKYNPYRLISHNEPCQFIFCQTHFAKQNRQIDDSKKKLQQPTDQNKKKNQKSLSKPQTIITEELKRNFDSHQDQKVQFKQINLIVLQNKNIKESCQKYFQNKKIQVKIQKLENQTFKKLTKQTYIIYHHKKFDEINTQLSEFKKDFNSKKNISLISAEKSVSVDCCLDCNQLKEVLRISKKEIQRFNDQKISYVEEIKDNQSKSYLRAESKKAGIYLYFILSQLNLKAKMKNVPLNLHNKLVSLEEAIRQRQSKAEKSPIKEPNKNNNQQNIQQNHNNKGQKNGNKNSNNFMNNQPYSNYQQQQIYQPYVYNQYQTQDPNYEYYQKTWSQYFISTYKEYIKMYGKEKAMEEFNKMLTSNSQEMYTFSYYQISNQPYFQQINQMFQRDYYNKVNYHNQFAQQQPY